MRLSNRSRRLTAAVLTMAGLTFGLLVPAPAFAVSPPAPVGLGISQPNSSTPILAWDLVDGATKYDVQVDNDPAFASPELNTTTTNRRIIPTTALPPGQVYWHVRAVNSANEKSDWSADQFTVAAVAKPVPLSPVDGTVLSQPSNPPLLSWSASQGATSYTVEVDGDADFIGDASYTTKTTSLVVPDPLGAGDYFWRVTATKATGIVSEPSDASTFVIGALAAPVLVAPDDSVNVAIEDVVLDWLPVRGAKTYDVQVALDAGFNNMALDVTGVQGTRYSPPVTLNNDQFWWRVRAVDLAGQPTAWTASNFGFQRQWLDKPQAVFPVGTVASPSPQTTTHPYYEWTPVQHASHYELYTASDQNFSVGVDMCEVAGTTYTPRLDTDCGFHTSGTTYWRVRPIDAPYPSGKGLPGIFSEVQAFTWSGWAPAGTQTTDYQPVSGLKISLTGSGLDDGNYCDADQCDGAPATPVLSWDPQPGITSYRVYYAQDVNFTTTELPTVPVTQNTRLALRLSDNVATLPESQAGAAYYWYVRPCNSLGCGPSPISQDPPLPGAKTFLKASPPVTGLTSSSPSGSEITFSWNDYFDTNHATTWFGEKSTQSAKNYRVQVDDEPSFSAPLVDERVVDQATYTAFDTLFPEGTLYWRVQAQDFENFGLAWSSVQSFTKSTPAVQLTGPADSSSVAGTTPFTWDAQAFAASYTLEVYKNNDAAFSPANKLFSTTVKTAAYAWNQPVPASATPYIWRVRKTDASGNPGPWSAPSRFTSVGTAPVLTAPASDELVPPNAALLQWTEVPDATKYDVEVRATGATSNWASATTTATAWAPLQTVPDGTWLWRVTAKDASNNPLGTSAWLGFRVSGTPSASQATQIQGSGAVDSTLTSIAPTWDYDGVTNSYQWQRNGAAIAGATGTSYVVTTTDIGKSITLKVTGHLVGYKDGTSVSNGISGVTAPAPTTSSPPTISGTGLVGSTLQATAPTWDQPGVTATYAWLRDGVAISGQTGLTYTVLSTDVGKVLTWRVTGKKTGYADAVLTSNGITGVNVAPLTTSAPASIAGSGQVTTVLQGTSPTWNQSGVTETYQWLRNGLAISGQTTLAYTVTSADLNKTLTLRVTGSKSGYTNTSVTSNGITGVPLPSLTISASVTIAGTGELGSTLQGTGPSWDQPGAVSAFQWLRDGSAIPGQTELTYTVAAADVGRVLSLRATGSKSGYTDTVVTSNGITGVPHPSLTTSSPVAIAGSGQVGSTLQATPPGWTQDGVTSTYQWLRDGSAIAGQSGPTYTVTPTDLGRMLSVRVTGSKSGWSDTVVDSSPITATAGPAPVASVAPGITGTPKVGSTLSATPGTWTHPAAFAYQWRRNGAAIPGATGASYALAAVDVGRQITVLVTATAPGYLAGSAASAPVTVGKASSTTTAALVKKTVPYGTAAKLVVTVKAPGVAGPTGKVKIRDGAKVIKTVTLTAAMKGKITVKLTKLTRGKHKLTAQYSGDAATSPSKSAVVKLTVGP
jgi:hypothetical protein